MRLLGLCAIVLLVSSAPAAVCVCVCVCVCSTPQLLAV